ncbi:hypothetical protein MASR2M39_13660 [Ignavibacteriales bacterium]
MAHFYFFGTLLICIFSYTAFPQNPEWVNYTYGGNVVALAEDGDYIWAVTTGGLVKIYKQTGSTVYYNKSNSGLPHNFVQSIAIDQSGNKWIGTLYGGLAKFDGTNWTVYNSYNSEIAS